MLPEEPSEVAGDNALNGFLHIEGEVLGQAKVTLTPDHFKSHQETNQLRYDAFQVTMHRERQPGGVRINPDHWFAPVEDFARAH